MSLKDKIFGIIGMNKIPLHEVKAEQLKDLDVVMEEKEVNKANVLMDEAIPNYPSFQSDELQSIPDMVYRGTLSPKQKAKIRAKNKRARQSRKINFRNKK